MLLLCFKLSTAWEASVTKITELTGGGVEI